jgi:hypothetical protein
MPAISEKLSLGLSLFVMTDAIRPNMEAHLEQDEALLLELIVNTQSLLRSIGFIDFQVSCYTAV